MKLRYVGPSFGIDSLTNGKIYEVSEDHGMYRVIDDSGEDYLYSMTNPAPLDGSSPGGRWEKVSESVNEPENGGTEKVLRWIASAIAVNEKKAQQEAAISNTDFSKGRRSAYEEAMFIIRSYLEILDIHLD